VIKSVEQPAVFIDEGGLGRCGAGVDAEEGRTGRRCEFCALHAVFILTRAESVVVRAVLEERREGLCELRALRPGGAQAL
jgi:hypothetical protein